MNTNIKVLRELDELVEAARLLGVTQAKKGFGCHTDEDRRFERAMYESIDKHRAAIEALRAEVELWRHKAAVHQYRRKRLAEALETCLEMEERPKVIELARAALAAQENSDG